MRSCLLTGLAILVFGLAAGRAVAQVQPFPTKDLTTLMLKDPNVDVRRNAAFALKFAPDSEAANAVPALIEALKDSDEVVRNNAVDALVLFTPGNVVPDLNRALKAKDATVRRLSAEALGRIRRWTNEALP